MVIFSKVQNEKRREVIRAHMKDLGLTEDEDYMFFLYESG